MAPLQAPKPPSEKLGLEGYKAYLVSYEAYVKAYAETCQVDAKVAKARLYSKVTEVPEKGPSVKATAATVQTTQDRVKAKVHTTTSGVSKDIPAKSPREVAAEQARAAQESRSHSRNLRRERRRLTAKLAESIVAKRFLDKSDPRIPGELVKAHKSIWPKARLVPGSVLPVVFATLKKVDRADFVVRFVNTLTVERISRPGELMVKGELVLPPGVPPITPAMSGSVQAVKPALPPRR